MNQIYKPSTVFRITTINNELEEYKHCANLLLKKCAIHIKCIKCITGKKSLWHYKQYVASANYQL